MLIKNKIILNAVSGVIFLIFTGFMLAGCAVSTDEKNSPEFVKCDVYGGCDGNEQQQYVEVTMIFDRSILVSDGLCDELRIVIGGERVKTEDIQFSTASAGSGDIASAEEEPEDNAVSARIHVTQVNDGIIEITPADEKKSFQHLTDASGKYSVKNFEIKKIIPSGVELEPGEEQNTTLVTSIANHRSIAWIRVFAGGEIISPETADTTDVMDKAIAVHEHDFLWATEKSTAEDIAQAVNTYFPNTLEAVSDEANIRITDKTGNLETPIQIKIYEY